MTSHSKSSHIALHASENKGIFSHLAHAAKTWHQRRALARLDAAALRDIGITAAQRDLEAKRPIWDVPAHWLR